MDFSVKEIAAWLQGDIEGNEDVRVNNLCKIEEGASGCLSFLANPKYTEFIYSTEASVVIVGKDFKAEKHIKATLIKVDNAYSAFAQLLNAYQESKLNKLIGISEKASIHSSATIGENSYIGAFVFIGEGSKIGDQAKIYPQVYIGMNVKIGSNCTLYPGVKILDDCVVGNNCTLHAGSVLGADGFGFAPQSDNQYNKIAQIGNVILEDNVEIGANTTIDRATMGSTIIHKGVKLDNLIQIAHNVEIGENTVMAALSGVAGSSKVGKNCMIGGQVAISGHLSVADGVKIAGNSGVASTIAKENEIVMGSPAYSNKDFLKSYIYFKQLPNLVKKIDELEKQIKALNSH